MANKDTNRNGGAEVGHHVRIRGAGGPNMATRSGETVSHGGTFRGGRRRKTEYAAQTPFPKK